MGCCNKRALCRCLRLQIENAALTQGTSATITIATTSLSNRCEYELRYCVCFTDSTGAEILSIINGTATYPVWDKDGEPLKIGRLRKGEMLLLKFISTGTPHFTLESCAYPMCVKTPATV